MNDAPEQEVEEESEQRTVSEVLVAARERQGISQKDVAEQLFLTVTFIRYLDEAQFQKIPKPAFIKGYLRSYARIVSLNGDEVVALYEAGLADGEGQSDMRDVGHERVDSSSFTGPVLQTAIVGLFVIIMLAALVWVLSSEDETESIAVEKPAPVQPTNVYESPSEVAANERAEPTESIDAIMSSVDSEVDGEEELESIEPFMEPITDPADELTELTPEPTEPEAVLEPDEVTDVTDLKEVTVTRSASSKYNYITVNAGGFEQLEFAFSGECWLEVTDGDGDDVYGDLNRDGDIVTLYGVAPFRILLGRATAVTLRYNREDVDLSRYMADDETAKVNIGG